MTRKFVKRSIFFKKERKKKEQKKVVARQASNTVRIIQILFFKLKMESFTLLALR